MTVGYEFIPRWRYITAITLGVSTVITFSTDHGYVDGEIISFRISKPYGTTELNNVQARVISHTDDTVTIDVQSSFFTPFVYPVAGDNTPPTAVPSASGIIPNSTPATVVLTDVFDNRPT